MSVAVTFTVGVLLASLASFQIGYLWTFEELTSKADLVVIAEPVRTEETGNRTEHPNLKPGLPVLELLTTFRVMAVLKADSRPGVSGFADVRVKHYQIDNNEWLRRNRSQASDSPDGLVNAGSYLDFRTATGGYLLFLTRGAADRYEPVSGHTFPTKSVYRLQEFVRPAG
jgi:hypothetical protein